MDIDALAEAWRRRGTRDRERRCKRAVEARKNARRVATFLRDEFGVEEVWLFGSLVSGPRHGAFDVDLAHREPSYLEVRGAGDIVHDFYNAVEHFFERVAVDLNGGRPRGPDSHARLLRRMGRPVEDVRPAVIADPVAAGIRPAPDRNP